MRTVLATLKVQETKVEEAKALLKELSAHARENEPGTLEYVVYQKKDEPTTFVVYERYESKEAFQTHSAHVASLGPRFGAVIAGAPEIAMLEEV